MEKVGASAIFVTAREVWERRRGVFYISTGVRGLDELLEGGVETQAITEFIGEFGAGKTQLCHQLAVMVQLPVEKGGLEAKALYIDAEGTFRPERIIQIAKYRGIQPEQALENIIYARAASLNELLEIVERVRKLKFISSIKIMILEGLPFLVRNLPNKVSSFRRNHLVWLVLKKVREIAEENNLAVVVTNQIVQKITETSSYPYPANNLLMGFFSMHRLWISKVKENVRRIFIYSSSSLPPGEAFFRITSGGAIDV